METRDTPKTAAADKPAARTPAAKPDLRHASRLELKRALLETKTRVHRELLGRMNLELMDRMEPGQIRAQIAELARAIMAEQGTKLNATEREDVVSLIQDEVLGLGPLEPLIADPTISDILVNTWRSVYVERHGKLAKLETQFQNDGHLRRIIDKIASSVGRRVDESSPMVDARLPDGSRVNAIIPPAAVDGPILSIRKFSADPYRMTDLIGFRTLTPAMGEFIEGCVQARVNILVSGGTGSGKTTLLNAMSAAIPADERVITIEDSAELQLQQPHVVRLETRPPNIEGRGEITQRDLVRNALRMRPDRIIVGEVRGAEALDMLQAMNTGHDGSLTTIHANSPRDALTRLEHMVGMSGVPIPALVVRQQIAAALHLLIATERLVDGRRVVSSIQEITGTEGQVVSTQEIFGFRRSTTEASGKVVGRFEATGIRPMLLKRLGEFGVTMPPGAFDPHKTYE